VTLVEMVMAMALMGIIMVSITGVLAQGLQAWRNNQERGELTQAARIVMDRVGREGKYATSVLQAGNNILEIGTKYLLDTDTGTEKVKYQLSGTTLTRSEDTGAGYGAANEFAGNVYAFKAAYENLTDNFDDNSLDAAKWTEHDTGSNVSESTQRINVTGSGSSDSQGIQSVSTFKRDYLMVEASFTTPASGGGGVGGAITKLAQGEADLSMDGSSGTADGNISVNGSIDSGSVTVNGTQSQNQSDSIALVDTSNAAYQRTTYQPASADTTVVGNYTFSSGTYTGVYHITGNVTIDAGSVVINGTVWADGKVDIKQNADGLSITPTGGNPAIYAGDQVMIDKATGVTLNGSIVSGKSIDIKKGSDNLTVNAASGKPSLWATDLVKIDDVNTVSLTGFIYSANDMVDIKKGSGLTISGSVIAKKEVVIEDVGGGPTITGLLHSWTDKVQIKNVDNLNLDGALLAKDEILIEDSSNIDIDWLSSLSTSPPAGFSTSSSTVGTYYPLQYGSWSTSGSTLYYVEFSNSGNVYFRYYLSGSSQESTSALTTWTTGKTYKVKLWIKPQGVDIYLDGGGGYVKIHSSANGTFTDGYVSWQTITNGAVGRWDDLTVKSRVVVVDMTISGSVIAKKEVVIEDVGGGPTITGLLHSWTDKVQIKNVDNLNLDGALLAKDEILIEDSSNIDIDWLSSLSTSPPAGFSTSSSTVGTYYPLQYGSWSTSGSTLYYVEFSNSGNVYFRYYLSGSSQESTSALTTWTTGKTYKVKLWIKPQGVDIYLDGGGGYVKIHSSANGTFTDGYVSWQTITNGAVGRWDDLTVKSRVVVVDMTISNVDYTYKTQTAFHPR
jgi:type II secretory pathway pseudopilin PulG